MLVDVDILFIVKKTHEGITTGKISQYFAYYLIVVSQTNLIYS